jgi:GNAT superfamily N-acetyltransferase
MATAELTVRRTTEGDRDAILDLIRCSLGEVDPPWSAELWAWKHEANPFGRSPVLVAESGGRIVGLRVFMRWAWRAGAEPIPAVRAVDTATHPEWQGQGIFSRLTRALVEEVREEGAGFIFNTPNGSSRPGYLKMGWIDVGRVSLWIRPLRPLVLLQHGIAQRRGRPDDSPEPEAYARRFGTITDFLRERGAEDLLERADRAGPYLRTLRSAAYWQWRYGAMPCYDYRALWEVQGADGALVVFRHKQRGGLSELRLCDFLVAPSRRSQRIGARLLREVLRAAPADYASVMASGGATEQRPLWQNGFLPAPRMGPILTVRPLNAAPAGPDPTNRGGWHLSIGDLEFF